MKSEGLNRCSRRYQDPMNTSGARSDWNSGERLRKGPGLNPFLAFKAGSQTTTVKVGALAKDAVIQASSFIHLQVCFQYLIVFGALQSC